MQGSGSASASSSCRAADYSAAWDAARQQKRQRCQVPASPALSLARLLRAEGSRVPLGVSGRYLRDSRAIGWCDRRVRFGGAFECIAAEYGGRVLDEAVLSGSEKFAHGERSFNFTLAFPCVCGLGLGGIHSWWLGAVVWNLPGWIVSAAGVLFGFWGQFR